jgi:hypothetical protein
VVLPGGGDWLLERSDDTGVLDVRATLQTEDGHLIYTNYRGYLYFPPLAHSKQEAGQPLDWLDYYWFSGNCRGKHLFVSAALPYHRAMHESLGQVDRLQNAEELFCSS